MDVRFLNNPPHAGRLKAKGTQNNLKIFGRKKTSGPEQDSQDD